MVRPKLKAFYIIYSTCRELYTTVLVSRVLAGVGRKKLSFVTAIAECGLLVAWALYHHCKCEYIIMPHNPTLKAIEGGLLAGIITVNMSSEKHMRGLLRITSMAATVSGLVAWASHRREQWWTSQDQGWELWGPHALPPIITLWWWVIRGITPRRWHQSHALVL